MGIVAQDDKPGALRRVLEDARENGESMADLTVLAAQNDPYRRDTPAGHRDGQWFRDQLETALEATGKDQIHLRGLHYAIVAAGSVRKPNGEIYRNTEADWVWLEMYPAKAARWLGYVPFEAIVDQRNSAPIIRRRSLSSPEVYVSAGFDASIPDIDPVVTCAGFEGRQPYHLVIFGEKSSLSDVAHPIAEEFNCDLYLPTGEISDSQLYQMARDGAGDGRPMLVFTLSDCDPAGWQMPISIGRKLQALRDLYFPGLRFEVRPVALTPEHVRELDLPSTPLKETEKRADRWRSAMGVEQTEIDALATLQPEVLASILREAIEPFVDSTLDERVRDARASWRWQAEKALAQQIDQVELAEIRGRVEEHYAELDRLDDRLRALVADGISLPPIEVPEPLANPAPHGEPLISSEWPWLDQTRALRARKAYEADEP